MCFFTISLEPVSSACSCICHAYMSMYAYTFTAAAFRMGPTQRLKARNGFLQGDIPGPLLATRTIFGNQKWSRVGPILAVKSRAIAASPAGQAMAEPVFYPNLVVN